ncbi:MAG: hypothetical protein K6U74_18790, partial [Firmicutes bacterium]|nr:hypothetical protein [Bacillota bacterium]
MKTKMKAKMRVLSILVTLSFLLTMIMPMTALASSDNSAATVPKVQNDSENVTLGTLAIREEADDSGFLADGDYITVSLPNGVEYMAKPTVGEWVYAGQKNDYFSNNYTDYKFQITSATKNSITVKAVAQSADNDNTEHMLYFYYNVTGKSCVDIDSDVTGDIKVEVEGDGTFVTEQAVTVARVVDGDTTTTISDVEDIAIDSDGQLGTIKIKENAAGVLDLSVDSDNDGTWEITDGNLIELTLPNDFKWVDEAGKVLNVTGSVLEAKKVGLSADKETLYIAVTGKSSKQSGTISIDAWISVPDDADEGDVEMSVEGNEVTEEDIVIATVGDFGFNVVVEEDVPTIVAGKSDVEIADFTIEELVPDSWIAGRTVTLELPTWAEWYEDKDGNDKGYGTTVGPLVSGDRDNDDEEILKYKVKSSPDGDAEFEDVSVTIDADAPEGDLTLKITGSAGVEDEVVVAKIVKPFTVTADKPELLMGTQNQTVGDITITETAEEAVDEDKWIIIKAPSGFTFDDDYDIEVTEGDMEIDNDDVEDNYLAFQVTGESNKASTITISNLTFDVD